MRRDMKISSASTKWVQRKYAFGAEGVPEGESEWLKVIYGFDGRHMTQSPSEYVS